MSDDDLDYLEGRAQTELEMAQRSESPAVTAAHYQLAEAYLERVETLRASAAAEPGAPGGEAPVDAKAAPADVPERRRAKFGERAEP